ncbi:MAG TPA: chromate resistance protein ChrB domain-containing protein [Burkholderiales bacterium]|nr:chromate resistance protein ChrB domain-containing protein [Burkholderiales bacterium]
MDAPSVSAASLRQSLASDQPPLVIDVRRNERFHEAPDLIRGTLRRDPLRAADWATTLPASSYVVVYCVHGHEVSQGTAEALRAAGLRAQYLEGGIERWRAEGGGLASKPTGASTRWVTRERPKIDRIACPWLIRRFVDPDAEFLYVPTPEVRRAAKERDAVPYDIPDVEFSHEGERCSFDAFLRYYRLRDPALDELAIIVRGADTNRLEFAPQAAGLAAISLGLSRNFSDDHEMLRHGMVMYDALYRWCKEGKEEVHTWNPDLYR